MILFLIIFVGGTLLSIIVDRILYHFIIRYEENVLPVAVGIGLFIAGIGVTVRINEPEKEYIQSESIISLRSSESSETSGYFLLFVGGVSSKEVEKLIYFTEDEYGIRKNIMPEPDWDIVRIKENNSENPRIEIYYMKAEKMNWFIDTGLVGHTPYRIIFYVPEGSVTNKFEIE
jgi:hypothetical protein